ncbi:SagB/ThcOx family dehydrogenase [Desulforhopalus sp. IMCC35007]|uniref:SagB/ThcOx family dehydrogenase n=1 Tax=Desulforhopalus sp. IMCC35007 TaxID=2569543 RepID=UPI0010AEBFFE|nr:SagB/ThcOx family dehydrogenase [Desulforhopalus sp. IMCC35007]TKB10870.1 SagB/ThcOx family dehydrogenase [Desulforhopalus sp. IMCC35007]
MQDFTAHRNFLKDSLRKSIDFRNSDQNRGVPEPPPQQPLAQDLPRIALPQKKDWQPCIPKTDLISAITNRKSRRSFNNAPLSIEELSFLLWATQGQRNADRRTPHFRTVPSAGARHSFETYLFIQRVETIPAGLYRFLPLSGEIVFLYASDQMSTSKLAKATFGQKFIASSAVTFVWTTVPYRMEWRYLEAAHRVILLDAGHVCQNLYLACENIGAGTCAIAAYDQEAMDALLGVDGKDEFAVYLAPVGKY